MKKQRFTSEEITKIILAAITTLGVVLAAYYTFREKTIPVVINATQTAEANLLAKEQLLISIMRPTDPPTPTLTRTETIAPTLTPTLTPTPLAIVDTSILAGWVPDFDHSKADKAKNKINIFENAIQLTYEIGEDGYVVITKSFDSRKLLGTEGIRFVYNGTGPFDTLEFKLLLRYPEHTGDTTYGIIWRRETNTDGKWLEKEVRYNELWCWGPSEDCLDHPEMDITMVDRLDFAVSAKPGDDPGSGQILIKDVFGIRP